ncbi:MAG: diguanylate cyclase [Gammaproteobacteria bacterium]|jgi:diguanylate cyclase (GGDEF)-like protein/PAS domain S-box-containing protein
MHEQITKTALLARIQLLEKQLTLLRQGLKQSENIKKLWQGSVAELKKTKVKLEQAEKELKLSAQVMEYSTEGICITDASPTIKIVNPAFELITGYPAKEAVGKNPNILSSGKHDKEFYQEMWSVLNKKNVWQGEIWNRTKEGSIYPEWLTICVIRNQNNEPINYIGIFADITQQKAKEHKLQYLANYDGLTNLPNRILFQDRLQQAMKRAKRQNKQIALFFMDLDRFKQVNDTHGHKVGDSLLQEVSTRLKACVREEDTVSRLGGDEFTIILSEIQSREGAGKLADKIIKTINQPYKLQNIECVVGISIGIGFYPQDAKTVNELIKLADAAMYKAKSSGRDCYQFAKT